MTDPRVERLAELLAGYSLQLREGDVVAFDGGVVASPLLLALYQAALRRGARPFVTARLPGLTELLLEEGSDEQIDFVSPVDYRELEALDALVTVWADENTRALSSADPGRVSRHIEARRELRLLRWGRISTGELRWAGTAFPTNAMAQDADMSLEDYERFVFRACHVEDVDEDAAAWWKSTSPSVLRHMRAAQPPSASSGSSGRTPTCGSALPAELDHGRRQAQHAGRRGLHEPYRDRDRRRYPLPVPGDLRGSRGRGRSASLRGRPGHLLGGCDRRDDYLDALLATDGAKVLGELAFGLNYEIDRFTRNILFDEKIGGTMHFALGAGFAQAGGENPSSMHWDMICDLREDGEVYADGELVWKAGRFLTDSEGNG